MPGEQYRHIFLLGPSRTQSYTSPIRGGGDINVPARDRARHSAFLRRQLDAAWSGADAAARQAVAYSAHHGAYIEFSGSPGYDLVFKSLEAISQGIRLMNVRKVGEGDQERTFATVYVPNDKRNYFIRRLEKYAAAAPHTQHYDNLMSSIADIKLAILESFWQDDLALIPGSNPAWVEVWISSDKEETVTAFDALIQTLGIEKANGEIKFPERTVKMIFATRAQLESLLHRSDDIAEFRLAKEVVPLVIGMSNASQVALARNLLSRTTFSSTPDTAICILDHGVDNAHVLIQPALSNTDRHTVESAWDVVDDDGHGTAMAGTAIYGDLASILNSSSPVIVPHCIESSKILPPQGQNPKELWGFRTSQGVSNAEYAAPSRKRIICMAVSGEGPSDRGRPSSWSACLDELASGYQDDKQRLFIISTGNTRNPSDWAQYPNSNRTNDVEDPGQSWNALTVGAYTEKNQLVSSWYQNYSPVAPAGDLSPYSRTSLVWKPKWPIKPEVLFEGGNVAKDPNNSCVAADDIQPLTTSKFLTSEQFEPFGGTSAATAQASWMAAQIHSKYPEAWPETVRALLVHSAEWTSQMKAQLPAVPSKRDYVNLLRVYGYGVPKLDRALYCAANSLTLISQAELQPFEMDSGRPVTRDMHLYNLPWPTAQLSELGAVGVKMRVTLSYFVEPGPGEIGWDNRYRYPSHALRFAVNSPQENEQEFIARINREARDESGTVDTAGPNDKWLIGNARNVGSIHSDVWEGTAQELAASNLVGIYPAVGWWRERKHLRRVDRKCRYSLLVSIYPPAEEIDIYTPVMQMVSVPIEIPNTPRGN